MGSRASDDVDLGFEADEVGAVDLGVEIGSDRCPEQQLERDAHVVAGLLGCQVTRDPPHDGLDQAARIVATRTKVGADRRDLRVRERVPVDDRPDEVLLRAEVVLGRRRVALPRALVDLADRHIDPAPPRTDTPRLG